MGCRAAHRPRRCGSRTPSRAGAPRRAPLHGRARSWGGGGARSLQHPLESGKEVDALGPRHRGEVGTRAEHRAGAGHDHDPDCRVSLGALECVDDRIAKLQRQGVARLWPVEQHGDDGSAGCQLDQAHLFDDGNDVALLDDAAFGHIHFGHNPGSGGLDRNLHLHRLQDADRVSVTLACSMAGKATQLVAVSRSRLSGRESGSRRSRYAAAGMKPT